jgi:hypothetical protein
MQKNNIKRDQMIKKRYLLFICLLFCILFPASLFSIDFGGSFGNISSFSTDEDKGYFQYNRLSLWLEAGNSDKFNFLTQGSISVSPNSPDDIIFMADLDFLLFTGKWAIENSDLALFSYNAGRFGFSDFSYSVLRHNADGLSLTFTYPSAVVTFGAGYTGLILRPSSDILMTLADSKDKEDDEIWLGCPRLIGYTELKMPDIFPGHTFYSSIVFQKDLRDEDDLVSEGEEDLSSDNIGGRLDSVYIGTGFSGNIVSTLFYNAFAYFQTGRTLSYLEDDESVTDYSYQYKPIFAFMLGTEFNFFLERALYSQISFKFLFASGDDDYNTFFEGNSKDNSTMFMPISNRLLSVIFNPYLTNIFVFDTGYSIKPFSLSGNRIMKNFSTGINAIFFFRATEGAISEDGINPDSDSLYLGTEIDSVTVFRPFSDLAVSLSLGFFIPSAGSDKAFNEEDREFEFLGKLFLSYSF